MKIDATIRIGVPRRLGRIAPPDQPLSYHQGGAFIPPTAVDRRNLVDGLVLASAIARILITRWAKFETHELVARTMRQQGALSPADTEVSRGSRRKPLSMSNKMQFDKSDKVVRGAPMIVAARQTYPASRLAPASPHQARSRRIVGNGLQPLRLIAACGFIRAANSGVDDHGGYI